MLATPSSPLWKEMGIEKRYLFEFPARFHIKPTFLMDTAKHWTCYFTFFSFSQPSSSRGSLLLEREREGEVVMAGKRAFHFSSLWRSLISLQISFPFFLHLLLFILFIYSPFPCLQKAWNFLAVLSVNSQNSCSRICLYEWHGVGLPNSQHSLPKLGLAREGPLIQNRPLSVSLPLIQNRPLSWKHVAFGVCYWGLLISCISMDFLFQSSKN